MDTNKISAIIDGEKKVYGKVVRKADRDIIIFDKDLFSFAQTSVELLKEAFTAKTGDAGFYLGNIDCGKYTCFLTYFKEREDFQYMERLEVMTYNGFGVSHGDDTFIAEVTGMPYDFKLKIGKQGDTYSISLFYDLTRINIYEDIRIELLKVKKPCTWQAMAKRYRKYQMEENNCVPIKERIKTQPELAYLKDSVEIRIRNGWKPAPPTVLEQTEENEPPMHVACTFARVKDIVDELKKQGVEKAELCLIGWNKSGHDGRWPTAFPVEEKLGGEKELRDLITYAQNAGYKIVCHTNSTDAYSISEYYDEGNICIRNKDGTIAVNDTPWSGGNMYWVCPKKGLEIAQDILLKVKDLGFKGAHYIDVMSVIEARSCFSEAHPCNARETLEAYRETANLTKENFGAFASEGACGPYVSFLDFGLYLKSNRRVQICMDEGVPFWELVFHGVTLVNESVSTLNASIKDRANELEQIETCGRPAFYFYSRFREDFTSWKKGEADLLADTDEDIRVSVEGIKRIYDDYKVYSHLQTELIEDYEKINENVMKTTFANGQSIWTNYGETDYVTPNGARILAKSWKLV